MKKLLLIAALLFTPDAFAKGVAYATQGTVTVTLTDEACKLKEVSNLPMRATWQDGGKAYEGCYGVFGPVVGGYFDDGSVAVMPTHDFKLLIGA